MKTTLTKAFDNYKKYKKLLDEDSKHCCETDETYRLFDKYNKYKDELKDELFRLFVSNKIIVEE